MLHYLPLPEMCYTLKNKHEPKRLLLVKWHTCLEMVYEGINKQYLSLYENGSYSSYDVSHSSRWGSVNH